MNTYIYCTKELKDMLQVSLYSMERSDNTQFLENLHIGTDRDSYDCISKAVDYPVECFDAIDLPCDSDFSHKSMAGKVQLVEKYGSGLIIDADTLFIKHIEFPEKFTKKAGGVQDLSYFTRGNTERLWTPEYCNVGFFYAPEGANVEDFKKFCKEYNPMYPEQDYLNWIYKEKYLYPKFWNIHIPNMAFPWEIDKICMIHYTSKKPGINQTDKSSKQKFSNYEFLNIWYGAKKEYDEVKNDKSWY